MTKDELNNEYFEWLYQLVWDERYSGKSSYRKLLIHLHDTEFVYMMGMDGNRADDGIDLRYRFGHEKSYEEPMISAFLDDCACSILEMMVALSMQCEKIMEDPDNENQTGRWFWNMIANLKLGEMSDSCFNKSYANYRINVFLSRDYERNGEGGLFTIRHVKHDMRTAEIWYQMCWYLDDLLNE